MPFAVKNLFDVAGLPTLAGSKINRDRPPATADAPLIARLEAAGAILVGALNMGEYAYDFTGENIHDGPSRNPHDIARMTVAPRAARVARSLAGSCRSRWARTPTARSASRLFLRPVRPEAHLRPAFPRALVPVRRQPRPSRSAGAIGARPGARLDAMQGPDPEDPVCADRPAEPTLPSIDHGIGACALRWPAAISGVERRPKPSRP